MKPKHMPKRKRAGKKTYCQLGAAQLIWSNNRPTKPGWYWCRNEGDAPGEIWEAVVRLDRQASGGELICNWMTAPGAAAVMTQANWSSQCLWAGPIMPPAVPTKGEISMERLLQISKEVQQEGGIGEQRLRQKCIWEHMSWMAVIRCWGDPRHWA